VRFWAFVGGFAESQTHPPTCRLPLVFLVRFWAVLGHFPARGGPFKGSTKTFLQKVYVENFSPRLFVVVLSRFRVFLGNGSSMHYKKRFPKKSCRKAFTKKSTKIENRFFSISFITFLGVRNGDNGKGPIPPKDFFESGVYLADSH
jgi:hypothetical protein